MEKSDAMEGGHLLHSLPLGCVWNSHHLIRCFQGSSPNVSPLMRRRTRSVFAWVARFMILNPPLKVGNVILVHLTLALARLSLLLQ